MIIVPGDACFSILFELIILPSFTRYSVIEVFIVDFPKLSNLSWTSAVVLTTSGVINLDSSKEVSIENDVAVLTSFSCINSISATYKQSIPIKPLIIVFQ